MEDLDRQIESLILELRLEGLLNDQFRKLLQLEDEDYPHFVKDLVALYCQETNSLLERIYNIISVASPEYAEAESLIHQLKGSSVSFGAEEMAALCSRVREFCFRQEQFLCQEVLCVARNRFNYFQRKMQIYLLLEKQKAEQKIIAQLPF